jgi:hypothetical protein
MANEELILAIANKVAQAVNLALAGVNAEGRLSADGDAAKYLAEEIMALLPEPVEPVEPVEPPKVETRAELLKRANMDSFAANTGIVRSTDNNFRLGVKSGMHPYGDCVSIQVMFEKNPGLWYYSHFSPARARVIANSLIAQAEYLERNDPGMRCVDKLKED